MLRKKEVDIPPDAFISPLADGVGSCHPNFVVLSRRPTPLVGTINIDYCNKVIYDT